MDPVRAARRGLRCRRPHRRDKSGDRGGSCPGRRAARKRVVDRFSSGTTLNGLLLAGIRCSVPVVPTVYEASLGKNGMRPLFPRRGFPTAGHDPTSRTWVGGEISGRGYAPEWARASDRMTPGGRKGLLYALLAPELVALTIGKCHGQDIKLAARARSGTGRSPWSCSRDRRLARTGRSASGGQRRHRRPTARA